MTTPTPLQHLPNCYEVSRYRSPEFGPIDPKRTNLKQELFNREWGEIYLEPRPYIDTYFSLVTETICAESNHSFRTEKIAKPIIAKRLFVVFSGPRYLEKLRSLGFRTFDGIIDESYDQESNDLKRFARAVEQMRYLSTQDPVELYQQVQPILEHNHQRVHGLKEETQQKMIEEQLEQLNQVVTRLANAPLLELPTELKEQKQKLDEEQKLHPELFPADWDKHGRAAGPIRNKQMADYADVLIAVWDGKSRGTKNMIDEMNKLMKPVYIVWIGEPIIMHVELDEF